MDQRHAWPEAQDRSRQGLVDVAEQQVAGIGHAVRIGRDLALEYENLPIRKNFAQVVVGAAVAQAQLQDWPRQAADLLGDQVQASALVPVPLARRRLVERGFNQSFELARDLGKGLGLPVMGRHLLRVRDTKAQSELGADLRHANVHNAFKVKKAADLPRRVALIDDVMTTGSTVNECARILKTVGVQSVSVWVVARAA